MALGNLQTVQHFAFVLMSSHRPGLCFPGVMDVHAALKLPQKLPQKPMKESPHAENVITLQ